MDQDGLLENYEFISDCLGSYWTFFIEFHFRKKDIREIQMLSAVLVHTILDNSNKVVLTLLSNAMVAPEPWKLFLPKNLFSLSSVINTVNLLI